MTPPATLRPRPQKYPCLAPTARLAAEQPSGRHLATPDRRRGAGRRLEAIPDPCGICGGGYPPDVAARYACRCGSA